jgi:hypothetical protein
VNIMNIAVKTENLIFKKIYKFYLKKYLNHENH